MGFQQEVDDHILVVDALGRMIGRSLRKAASEQATPFHGGDQSDDVITDSLKMAKDLRFLREQFENVTTGAIIRERLLSGATPNIG